MEHRQLVRLSKRMSLVLRHDPARAGLALDPAGWVRIDDLLAALRIGRAEFDAVVAGDDKQRFAVDRGPDGAERVRANQGHTVPVDLQLPVTPPPDRLYHGTTAGAAASIRATGIDRGRRHHVHLSVDEATAYRVGARRRGEVAILVVDAGGMARDGYRFFRSANGVWLTDHVPPGYLLPS